MKQNEKILVYAVTGFLVVILMLAVLLGTGDGKRGAGAGGSGGSSSGKDVAALSLEDLLGNSVGGNPVGGNTVGNAAGERKGTGAGHGDADQTAANGDPAAAQAAGDKPLLTNVQLLPPTAASMVTEKLGLSRRDRDYRIVRVQPKDTLSTLVQKWCGKTDGYLEMAQGLNEELGTLHTGQEINLPWIDDEVLLAAINARTGKPVGAADAVPATAGGAGDAHVAALDADAGKDADSDKHAGKKDAGKKDTGAADKKVPEAKPASGTRKITLKAGDTLWKIAEREVGRKAAGKFISQVRELNPGIDPDHLREGLEIRLPPNETHPDAGRPTN
jgi:phage tail protein X